MQKICVVIVDDDPVLARALAHGLEVAHDVVIVDSAERAIERIRQGGVDVVLSDLHMPGTSGLVLLQIFAKTQPGLRLLLMSADALDDQSKAQLTACAGVFLQKPFGMALLRAAIDGRSPA